MSCEIQPKQDLNLETAVDTSIPVFDAAKTERYHKLTDYFMSKIFAENADKNGWTVKDLLKPENAKRMVAGLKASFENMLIDTALKNPGYFDLSAEVVKDVAETLIPNVDQFLGHYFKFNPIATIEDLAETTEDPDSKASSSENEDQGSVREEEEDDDLKPSKEYGETQENPIKLASKETKLLFRLTPKMQLVNGQPQLVFDSHGLPMPTDFGPTFNLLLNKMAGTKDYHEFISMLTSIDTLRVIPEAQHLSKLLKVSKPGQELTPNEFNLFTKFYQSFSKPKIPVQSLLMQANGNIILINEIVGNITAIRQQFAANFQSGEVHPSMATFVAKDELEGWKITSLPREPQTQEEQLNFLSLLGIKFTGVPEFLDTEAKMEEFETLLNNTVPKIYISVENRMKNGEVLRDPLSQLRKAFSAELDGFTITTSSEARSIDQLVEFEGRFSKLTPSLSVRNGQGELQYLISLDNQLSIATYHLNHAQTLEDLYNTSAFKNAKYNPLFAKSRIISYLFDQDGNRIPNRQIDLTNLSAYKEENGGRSKGTLERDLAERGKLIQDFYMMFLSGKTDIPRTETSHSFFSYAVKNTTTGANMNYVNLKGFPKNFKDNEDFKSQIFRYLSAEKERIASYDSKKIENPTLPSTYGEFSIFYSFLKANPTLEEHLRKNKIGYHDDFFQNDFMKAYDQWMEGKVKEFKDRLDALEISYDQLGLSQEKDGNKYLYTIKNELYKSLSADALFRGFIANTFIQNIEFSILYSGDPLFFKDYHKRLKGLSSTGDLASILPIFEEYRSGAYEKGFHRDYSLSGAMGVQYRDNHENFHTNTLKEYAQSEDFAYTQPEMVDNIYNSILKRDGVENEHFTKDQIKNNVLDKAHKQDPADGQGYYSIDFEREMALRYGYHTNELEQAYKYEGLVFRKYIMEQELSPEQEKELSDLEQLVTASPKKYGIGVRKVTYFGALQNTTVDAKAYDKLSIAPLVPSDVKDKPILRELLKDMVRKQVGYVKYESGTKLFKTQPVNIEDLGHSLHDQYQTELLKLQIKPKEVQNSTTAIPTQMMKLIFSNLFDGGKPRSERAGQLYQNYLDSLKSIQGVQTKRLLDELGFNKEGVDMSKLSERLIAQAKAQGLNSTTIEALQVRNGNFIGVLEESGFINQITDLIAGMADTKLRRYEFPGGDFVLISDANRWVHPEDRLKFYTYTDGATQALECRITLTEEHTKLLKLAHPTDKQPIATRDRLNSLLKNKKWVKEHEKELTVILDRVPTQGPNSMDFAIVKEFLSPTMGSAIVLPEEIVYKSGTDFDYDKEKVLLPSLTKDGKYIGDISHVEDELEALRKERKDLLTELYNSDNPSETVRKIREYIKDITKLVKKGEFEKFTLDAQEEDLLKGLRKSFTQITNLEVAKDFLDNQLNEINDYYNFENPTDKFPAVLSDSHTIEARKELEEIRNNINEVTDAFYAQLKKFRSGAAYQAINDGYGFRDKIRELLQLKNKHFESHANKIIEIYKETLALPEMFAELVMPNSTRTLKPIAEDNGASTGTNMELPKRDEVFDYLQNLKVKDIYFMAKNMLAPFAVDNTFMQLLQYSGIDIQRAYSRISAKGKKMERYIHNLLLDETSEPGEKSELNKVSDDESFKTSLRNDINNYIKQHFDSEAINATVDAAKDPWFAKLNVVFQNIGVVNFMKNLGIPFERIVMFVNQPVLRAYVTLQQNGMSKLDALAEVGSRLGIAHQFSGKEELLYMENEEDKAKYEQLKSNPEVTMELDEDAGDGFTKVKYSSSKPATYFDLINAFQAIEGHQPLKAGLSHLNDVLHYRPITPDMLKDRLENEDGSGDDFNLRILAHFVMMDQHQQAFRDFQRYFSFDKKKVSTPTEIKDKETLRHLILETGMFTTADIEKMEQNSIQTSFINNDTLSQMFNKVLPVLGQEEVQNTLNTLYKSYTSNFDQKNKRDERNMPKVLNSDFVRALIFNFNVENGQSFIKRNKHLLIREPGKRTMADRLERMKSMPFYEKLVGQFPVLDQLVVSKHRIDFEGDLNGLEPFSFIENIQLLKPAAETRVESESTIKQLADLRKHKIRKTKAYTREQIDGYNKALHQFMEDLFTTGILQSGIEKSYLGFSEYIPASFKRGLFQNALQNFRKTSAEKGADYTNFLEQFRIQFVYNNPKYFPSIQVTQDTALRHPNNYSNRFKNYDIGLSYTAVPAVRDPDAVTEEDAEWSEVPQEQKQLPNSTQQILPKAPKEKSLSSIKRMEAKDLYKRIKSIDEPSDAYGMALSYIAGGGKISIKSYQEEAVGSVKSASLNTGEKEKGLGEEKADFLAPKGPSIAEVAHSIWDELSEMVQNRVDVEDIRQELIDVVTASASRYQTALEYFNKYGFDSGSLFGQNTQIDPPQDPPITPSCG